MSILLYLSGQSPVPGFYMLGTSLFTLILCPIFFTPHISDVAALVIAFGTFFAVAVPGYVRNCF
jgi:hypothetical protein